MCKKVSFSPCDDVKCIEAEVHIDDEGHMLVVPVYLCDVCTCRKIIVGVQVYVCGRLYAMKTKEICTGGCPCCSRICQFYVGDFNFLFTNIGTEEIDIKILAHYIY